jgi:hypothetical protein
LVACPEEVGEWYVAMLDGQVTQITISHIGRGKFSVLEDRIGRFYYRIIDASDIICLAESEKSRLIVDALFSGYSQANVP